jgi:hypothetical protein
MSVMLLSLSALPLSPSFIANAKEAAKQAHESKDPRREKLIGNILKNALETYHYRALKINDEVSQKAFAQYLKRLMVLSNSLPKGILKNWKPISSQWTMKW